ncbi:peroxisomal targeting signal 2 receptor [Malassezia sp. CBS 17886]|nr:peroxisomal targeting signal 2 receptor [Malassezia sp. CBS 17886]
MLLATASGDGTAQTFDLRVAAGPGGARPVAVMPVGGEVLGLDWNKYRPMTLATGSTDRTVKVWDARSVRPAVGTPSAQTSLGEAAVLVGHQYAVRNVAWSPHEANCLASASYDMSARLWNVDDAARAAQVPLLNRPRQTYPGHREFVMGLAWSLFEPGWIATTSWDTETHVWPVSI